MRALARLIPLVALASCAAVGRWPGGRTASTTLPPLPRVTHVDVMDVELRFGYGTVERADSVAALATLYRRLSTGWTEGAAPSPVIRATFYNDSGPVATLTLTSGAFETRVGDRVLRRPANPDEALAFALLAGVPIRHGPNERPLVPPFGVQRLY